MLPVINAKRIEQAVRTGLGLGVRINLNSIFDRKNYFYADPPAGYQISQYKQPIVGKGEIQLISPTAKRKVGITRLHLEMDAGKSLHDQSPNEKTYVDLNRSGVALMEIVSEPEYAAWTKRRRISRNCAPLCVTSAPATATWKKAPCAATSTCPCVAWATRILGTRCEIKNVNSIRFVQQAIDYEARRQVEVLDPAARWNRNAAVGHW